MAKIPARILFEDGNGDNLYRTLDLGPLSEWGEEVAKEYIGLRISSANELKNISVEGITVVDVQTIRERLRKVTVPLLGKGPLDIVRSDFGETIAYLILEKHFSTAIGYKGVRDRETVKLPGRGIDISYRAYAYGKKDPLLDEHPIYQELSKEEPQRRERYREFVKGTLRSKGAMRGEMDRRAIYGSGVFADKLKKAYQMEEIIKPIGRPKKEAK